MAISISASALAPPRGTSPTAAYLFEAGQQNRRRLQNSYYWGLGHQVFEELADVFKTSQAPGWDGDAAEPVSHEAYLNAWRVLESLPLGLRAPSVGAEPDGHLTLEWHQSPRRTISVSVSPDGFLYYAALMGLRKANGCEPFFGEFPHSILELIGQIDSV